MSEPEERVEFVGWFQHEGRRGFGVMNVSKRDLDAFYAQPRFGVFTFQDSTEVLPIYEFKEPQDEVRFVEEEA